MFLRMGDHKRSVPAAVLVPNFLTTLALCSGLASLHFALAEQWERALAAVVLAGVFDVLDGAAARLLRVSSRFGAVLDSLSDFLAFGVAPAVILQQWVLRPPTAKFVDSLSLVAVMTFAVCAALRLARFTSAGGAPTLVSATLTRKPSLYFTGMPTPAGAGAALAPAFLIAAEWIDLGTIPEWALSLYLIVIGLLMVSRVPMFALKGVRVSRRWTAPLMVLLVVLAALMVRRPWTVLAGISVFYVLTVPWAWALARRAKIRDASARSDAASRVDPVLEDDPVHTD
jgi:CDP-diacylglycerol--serine O-phosphatidyltransferase